MAIEDGDGLFGRLAVHLRLITLDQLVAATTQQGRNGEERPLGKILVDEGLLTEESVQRVLTLQNEVLRRRTLLQQQNAQAAQPALAPELARAPTLSQVIEKSRIDDAAPAQPPTIALPVSAPASSSSSDWGELVGEVTPVRPTAIPPLARAPTPRMFPAVPVALPGKPPPAAAPRLPTPPPGLPPPPPMRTGTTAPLPVPAPLTPAAPQPTFAEAPPTPPAFALERKPTPVVLPRQPTPPPAAPLPPPAPAAIDNEPIIVEEEPAPPAAPAAAPSFAEPPPTPVAGHTAAPPAPPPIPDDEPPAPPAAAPAAAPASAAEAARSEPAPAAPAAAAPVSAEDARSGPAPAAAAAAPPDPAPAPVSAEDARSGPAPAGPAAAPPASAAAPVSAEDARPASAAPAAAMQTLLAAFAAAPVAPARTATPAPAAAAPAAAAPVDVDVDVDEPSAPVAIARPAPAAAAVAAAADDVSIDVVETGQPRFVRGINVGLAKSWCLKMLAAAVTESASDVHFHCDERVRMRVHGRLVMMTDRALPSAVTRAALTALLKDEERALLETQGHVECALSIEGVGRFRANIYMTARGLDGVFRIVKSVPPTLSQLGLPLTLARLTTFHQGIVLCTGPAGSGKTSTMAALVNMINEERAEHVVTIEDPIEVVHKSQRCIVNQRQAGKHTAGFERALKAALREDPDVIVIGEMRDRETAALALTAAETGHLVLATLHTHSAVRTIHRIVGEFPPQQQPTIRAMLSESLRAVVSQRLLPRKDVAGVIPAVEVLYCTPAVSFLIRESRTHQIRSTMQTGGAHGMQLLDTALKDLVTRGLVAPDVARKHAEDPKALD